MKKILSLMAIVLLAAMSALSQSPAPGIFNYQGVARNSVGNVLANKSIALRLTIHDGTAAGPTVYQETRGVTTNPFGLFNVQVGSAGASNVTGTIAGVNLGTGGKFIQVEIDPNGGTVFINIGTAQLASVPYSLYSSLANDLVLPFNKTQADAGALFKITNSGTGITLHTTGPVRLQGISEAVNRILASDAAGNASWKDPTAVNIVTGSGTLNFVPKWTPSGTNIGNSQIFDNGANIGMGTVTPNVSAQLDVSSTTKGILAPRMTSAQRTAIASPANGLLVFDNTANSFWFYNGAAWTEILTSSTGWGLTGNAGTNPAVNFIGTTDDNDVIFKRNNIRAGSIGVSNTSYGLGALNPASTGTRNTANGYEALYSNTTGFSNTANGYEALYSNTTGFSNTANGAAALNSNTTGVDNTANGANALNSNTTGDRNTANGSLALFSNTFGYENTANGVNALRSNTTGFRNTANGANALNSNTTGNNNTGNGYEALYSNTTGFHNTSNGVNALYSNTTGANNTANGVSALYSNTTGTGNTANGVNALRSNTSGDENTANGVSALFSNTTGINNTANGFNALYSNTTGAFNTANGSQALSGNTTGIHNTAIGVDALYFNRTGNGNTAIGTRSDVDLPNSSQNTIIGAFAHVIGNNNVVIGNGSFTNVNNLALLGSVTTTLVGGYANWSNFSDGRFKTGVNENVKGLDFILRLRPVTYHMDVRGIYNLWSISPYGKEENEMTAAMKAQIDNNISSKEAIRMSGFIAQEVEKAAEETGYDFDGVVKPAHDKDHYRIAYAEFVVPLVKAMQEQQKIIEELKKEITAIRAQLKR